MELRPYQKEAVEKIFAEWGEKGNRKTLLVLPTGCGKTIVFSKIAERCVANGEKVLILAHRGELLEQAMDKIEKTTGLKSSLEKAENSSKGEWFRIVVGSVQTIQGEKRLGAFKKDEFDTIIVDEAHHILSNSYQKIMEYFNTAKVLGVTATADRGDMRNLGEFFDSLAYEYTLPSAIREGFLSPIKALTVPLKLDISKVGMSGGDFKSGEVATALDPFLESIASEMERYCNDRKTVVFLPLVATSQKFCEILNRRGFNAVEVNGNSSDREEALEGFDKGRYNVLCNSMLLTEGWDCPSVDCVIVLRPTKVRSLYCQMIGRGTRLSPGKKDLLLLDFLWHTERHELCHPSSLIAKSSDVARKMDENLASINDEAVDLEEAELIAESDVQEERERALAEELEKMKRKKRKLVDPLQYEMSIQAEDLSSYVPSFGYEMAPPSDKQVAALEKFGIFPNDIPNSGYASLLIDRLKKRAHEGLSTPKQIRFLEGRGFIHVGQWCFDDASRMIGRISSNGWRTPPGINPGTYVPESLRKEI